jgi:autotransporter passenger strand-loop-strand repeat protein
MILPDDESTGFRYYRQGLRSAAAKLANTQEPSLAAGSAPKKIHRLSVCPEGGGGSSWPTAETVLRPSWKSAPSFLVVQWCQPQEIERLRLALAPLGPALGSVLHPWPNHRFHVKPNRVSGRDIGATLSGGLEVVSRTGVAGGTTVLDGGSQIDLGTTVATVLFGGTETVSSGGTASNTVVLSGGSLVVLSHGLADPATIYGGGLERPSARAAPTAAP